MKLKSWMEAHIVGVRSKRKNKKEAKKEKQKKGNGNSVSTVVTATSAAVLPHSAKPPPPPVPPSLQPSSVDATASSSGNSTSNLLVGATAFSDFKKPFATCRPGSPPYCPSGNVAASAGTSATTGGHSGASQSLTPANLESWRQHHQRQQHQTSLWPCFGLASKDGGGGGGGGDVARKQVTKTPPFLQPWDHLQENSGNVSSPRQRSKIRTNPWLTPNVSTRNQYGAGPGRSLLASTSSSSSDCGSTPSECGRGRWRRDSLASTCTPESSADSASPRPDALLGFNWPNPLVASAAVHAAFRGLSLGSQPVAGRASLPNSRVSSNRFAMAADEDSDSEEGETLREMGNFKEHYEYDRETDIVDDDIDESESHRRGQHVCSGIGVRRCLFGHGASRKRYNRPPPITIMTSTPETTRRLLDLHGNDEDYSEKLEFVDVDEAFSEASGSLEDVEAVIQTLREDEEGTKLDCETPLTPADSAFPSDSELSSLMTSAATTPLLETASASGSSDSGLQSQASPFGMEKLRHFGVGDVTRENLEDKVRRLRRERLLVEEKIREAKEEERARRLDRENFRQELALHRRQVLLRTLDDLRSKFEEQSVRLQDAYQVTLEMQLSRHNRHGHRMQPASGKLPGHRTACRPSTTGILM